MSRNQLSQRGPSIVKFTLSADLVNSIQEHELREAFQLFDTERTGNISVAQARNVLRNFGFNQNSESELEDLMLELSIDHRRQKLKFNEIAALVGLRQKQGGSEQELIETFKVFAKKKSGTVSVGGMKETLRKLHITVHEGELEDILKYSGINPTGDISYVDFTHL